MKDYLLSIKEAAELLAVSTKTIRRWEQQGKIKAIRTAGGHRRFNVSELLGTQNSAKLTIVYARIGKNQSSQDLADQIAILQRFCRENNWTSQVIRDVGGGLNGQNPGLVRLIKLICAKQVKRLILTHKDRLLRIGADLVLTLCEIFGTEVMIINRIEDSLVEEELTEDFNEMITVFKSRLYGSRNSKNAELLTDLQEIARRLG
ncbi:DNA binding domain protein, excisionase family [Rippkaea orientalis PCC 8801]|uniref:DNA binding domain protein, excisionase family n=1 Tax=Rippkaea orientalis (strain PCC 8801 / RF-1) TaxID=41431 RepID=B7K4D6_RIPO1|nr:IS607 family transposase [Rippkaea orientalis]ACK67842.1 DNA binding domain protein, excisionase family [Rippkaea orientalis PCC 8801]